MDLYDPNLLTTISFTATEGEPAYLQVVESPWLYCDEESGYYETIYKDNGLRYVQAGVRYAYKAQLRIDGDDVTLPSEYTINVGKPARFDDTSDIWQKKNGDVWEDYTGDTFTGGTYRLKVKLIVDGESNDTHYLDDSVFVAPNGHTAAKHYWTALDAPTVAADSSYVWMVSPEHKIDGPAATTIDTINITGITAPAAGEAPVTSGITTDTIGITYTQSCEKFKNFLHT